MHGKNDLESPRFKIVDGMAVDNEKDGLFGADQEPLEERDPRFLFRPNVVPV
jgi:hypothetical protein